VYQPKHFSGDSANEPSQDSKGRPMPKFKFAGGQPLPVQGRYQFNVHKGTKFLKHDFYVIPELNESLILWIDFIQKHQLYYCPKNSSFAWEEQPNWGMGHLKVCSTITIPPLSAYLKAYVQTEAGAPPGEGNLCVANVASNQHPLVTGGPYLVSHDQSGHITIAVKNCAPTDLELQCNDFIGSLENIEGCETCEINTAYLQAVSSEQVASWPMQKLSATKRQFIENN
jgi:hypothetical protein